MAGRKPKPREIRELEGNPGKRPLPANGPSYPVTLGKAPASLDRIGGAEWRRISKLLTAAKVLTEADFKALEAYCTAYSIWRQAAAVIKKGGPTYAVFDPKYLSISGEKIVMAHKRRPELGIMAEYLKIMRSYASDLGLTPASRTKVTRTEDAERDPFEEFLNSGGIRSV
jgi:P27 family predicted phage terminase small subunit